MQQDETCKHLRMLRMAYSNLGYRNDIGYKNYVSDGKKTTEYGCLDFKCSKEKRYFPPLLYKKIS